MIALIIIGFIGVALFDVPALIRKKHWYELKVYSFFLLIAFTLAMLTTLGVKIPSSAKGIEYLIKDLLHLSYG